MTHTTPTETKPKLTIAVIAKNEADRIPVLLQSASIADEIVVVDSGSSDGTADVCRTWGARVVQHEWLGYAAQKQLAMDLATGDWILNLDADEALSVESSQEILQILRRSDPEVNGYSLPRMSRYLGRWILHGGWYPDRKIRLVRRGCGKWIGDTLHEKLEVAGKVDELQAPLLHYVYRDIVDQVRTINRFSSVSAAGRKNSVGSLYVLLGVLHAVGKFIECAIWKRGFLDGIPGIIIAMNSAFYIFLKHAKAWEKGISQPPSQ